MTHSQFALALVARGLHRTELGDWVRTERPTITLTSYMVESCHENDFANILSWIDREIAEWSEEQSRHYNSAIDRMSHSIRDLAKAMEPIKSVAVETENLFLVRSSRRWKKTAQ